MPHVLLKDTQAGMFRQENEQSLIVNGMTRLSLNVLNSRFRFHCTNVAPLCLINAILGFCTVDGPNELRASADSRHCYANNQLCILNFFKWFNSSADFFLWGGGCIGCASDLKFCAFFFIKSIYLWIFLGFKINIDWKKKINVIKRRWFDH